MADAQSSESARRVVVRGNAERTRHVTEDALLPDVIGDPGAVQVTSVWGSDVPARIDAEPLPAGHRFFPPPGGYRVTEIVFAPASQATPGPGYEAERRRLLPGYDDDVDIRDGLHASATVDVVHVADGAITLRLPDNQSLVLEAGDWLVQDGALHAWHNHTDRPCRLIITMLGAPRRTDGAGLPLSM